MDALILLSFTLSVLLGIARTADLLLGTDPVSGLCVVGPVWVRYAALGAAVLAAVLVGRHCAGSAKNLQQPKKSAGVLSALAGVLLVVTAGLRLYFAQFMGVTWGIRAVLELLCAVWMLVLARSWLSKTGWTAPKGGLPLAVLGSVLFYWNVLMRFMENSSSWHRAAPTSAVWQMLAALLFLSALARALYLPEPGNGKALCASGLAAFCLCLCWEFPQLVQGLVYPGGYLTDIPFHAALCLIGMLGGVCAAGTAYNARHAQ